MEKKNKGKTRRTRDAQAAQLKEQIVNLNAWAMEQIRTTQQRGALLDMLTTCVVLLIKDCLGYELSQEELDALAQAIKETGYEAQEAAGDSAPSDGDGAGDGGAASESVGT